MNKELTLWKSIYWLLKSMLESRCPISQLWLSNVVPQDFKVHFPVFSLQDQVGHSERLRGQGENVNEIKQKSNPIQLFQSAWHL